MRYNTFMHYPRILDQHVRAYGSMNSMATEGIGFELYRPHHWHGLTPGVEPPRLLHAYIEITPFDPVKYEIDKVAGDLNVDRPQRSSSLPPALFGFPQDVLWTTRRRVFTRDYSSRWRSVRHLCAQRASHQLGGNAARRPRLGRLSIIDNGATDNIVAVLRSDNIWGEAADTADMPARLVERLRHYFETYRMVPGSPSPAMTDKVCGVAHAEHVVRAAMEDYNTLFGDQIVSTASG